MGGLAAQRPARAGFTLIEILAAVAIVGTSLLLLLDSHFGALQLFSDTRDEVLMQSFLEQALGLAEAEVMAGKLEGSGDFGSRYDGYSYVFSAQPIQEDQMVPLYQLTVNITSPTGEDDNRSMQMLLYHVGY